MDGPAKTSSLIFNRQLFLVEKKSRTCSGIFFYNSFKTLFLISLDFERKIQSSLINQVSDASTAS